MQKAGPGPIILDLGSTKPNTRGFAVSPIPTDVSTYLTTKGSGACIEKDWALAIHRLDLGWIKSNNKWERSGPFLPSPVPTY